MPPYGAGGGLSAPLWGWGSGTPSLFRRSTNRRSTILAMPAGRCGLPAPEVPSPFPQHPAASKMAASSGNAGSTGPAGPVSFGFSRKAERRRLLAAGPCSEPESDGADIDYLKAVEDRELLRCACAGCPGAQRAHARVWTDSSAHAWFEKPACCASWMLCASVLRMRSVCVSVCLCVMRMRCWNV